MAIKTNQPWKKLPWAAYTLFFTFFIFASASGSAANPTQPKLYTAGTQEGQIGATEKAPADNPADNVFHVLVEEPLKGSEQAWLVYEVDGVEDHTAVSRGINDQLSVGGYLVRKRSGWSRQRERIDATWLRTGDNVIRFTLPKGAKHNYRVRNVGLEIQAAGATPGATERIVINQPQSSGYYHNQAYIKGFIQGATGADVQVKVDGKPVRVFQGEFEALVPTKKGKDGRKAEVEVHFADGQIACREVRFERPLAADYSYALSSEVGRAEKLFSFKQTESISLAGTALTARSGARQESSPISVTTLREVDIPALDPGMVNVTRYNDGFRYLPHRTTFEKEVDLRVGYDESKIPAGYTEKDIKTYYFDEETHHWVPLPLDSVYGERAEVASRTTHFTDMINAIMMVPESPEAQAYTPTSMKGIQAANPTAVVNLIQAPQANNTGSASMGYPINLPAGRGGMQPQLAISYNSGGGDSWLGLGWNLSTPSITIDTRWGVPRYDATKETETYSMNGEQLSPTAHRSEPQARSSEKQFYPRVEGAFSRIIRHGGSPKTYWWEVTDKSGVTYSYGGSSGSGVNSKAILADEAGNIAHWALVEVRDLSGNFMRYHYDKVTDTGVQDGTVPGYQLYVDKITYTGHGSTEGSYAVLFTRDRDLGEAKRKDININARYGFKQVTADLLRKVEVRYAGKPVRSYELKYVAGAFHKTLLSGITEFDAGGKKFTEHSFDYYDDVKAKQGYVPFKNSESWNPQLDNVQGGFLNLIKGFGDEASALSGTKSTDFSAGMAVTVGFNANVASKSLSAGANFSYSQSTSEGLLSMIDINGDGLPDKVFVKEDGIRYRPNLSGPAGQPAFGELKPVLGINAFHKERSKTVGGGLEAHGPGVAPVFAGVSKSTTTSTTTVYFSEVNGDQLPDVVVNGKVYFNHVKPDGSVVFTASSSDTESPINQGGKVAEGILKVDPAEREQAIDQNPLHDVVRMWQAPYTGKVTVTAPVQLMKSTDPVREETPADGVRVAIQLKSQELWNAVIGPDDYAVHVPAKVNNLSVQKGDRLYFRVQSVANGSFDQVQWAPSIEYTNKDTDLEDANGKKLYSFAVEKDYLLSGNQVVTAPIKGRVKVEGTFSKPVTSDDVQALVVSVSESGEETTVWQKKYAGKDVISENISLDTDVLAGESFAFRVKTDTNVDWPALSWTPRMYYTASGDPAYPTVYNAEGKPLIDFYAAPSYSIFPQVVQASEAWEVSHEVSSISLTPELTFNSSEHTGVATFTVKRQSELLLKETLTVVRGQFTAAAPFTVPVNKGDKLYIEYHIPNDKLAGTLSKAGATVVMDKKSVTANAGVHTLLSNKDNGDIIFGPMYRGWGHFAYNGNRERASRPINEVELKLSDAVTDPKEIDPDKLKDGRDLESAGGYDPSKDLFIVLAPVAKDKLWTGADAYTYLSASTISSSRMGDDDVSGLQPLPGDGEASRAIHKITRSTGDSFSAGGSFAGLGGSYGKSLGETRVLTDFMDMNGDSYPDVVTEERIQYTASHGALSDNYVEHGNGPGHVTQSESDGVTLSASFPTSEAKSSPTNAKKVTVSVGSGQSSAGLSGNYAKGKNSADFSYIDINGDGLPDRVYKGGDVSLNLGYRFAAVEKWGFTDIQSGDSESSGAGLGISIANGSISAGVSLSRSDNATRVALQDVNGDGLVDEVLEGDPMQVRLNTGSGFTPLIKWQGAFQVNENSSASESANLAFTAGIYIPVVNIKICFNPSTSVGRGMSRELSKMADVNGDGFPDYVRSEKDDQLVVSASTIGRTNMLKSVKRPLGASFVLNYERQGNSYEMPQAMWALSRVAMFDGYKGDGPDSLLTTFAYEDGYYDRHEREFYGFAKVITRTHDTGNENAVYASTEQVFKNSSYYEKGLLVKELLKDADGKPYVEKENIFELHDAATGARLSTDSTPATGSVYPALTETQQRFYEGQPQAGKSTRTRFDYDRYGNVTRIEDYGDEDSKDDLFAQVTYHYKPESYIMSLPSSVEVSGTDKVYRKREAEITDKGQVSEIRQYLTQDKAAVYSVAYDAYGNLSKVTRPENAEGQRFSMSFTYDEQVHTYVTKVSNSYGYSSEATYDFRFGQVLSSKDMNGNLIQYTIDNLGRLETVKGPYEMKSGAPFTIRFEYHTEAQVPWALTRHYDPAFPNNFMETATFVDGLGRVLQTKKDAALYQGDGTPDKEVMVVSGKVLYDGLGRATHAYYPVTEELGSASRINTTVDKVKPTFSTYDVMDRTLTVTLPDGAVSKTEYGFGSDFAGAMQFRTMATDANGIVTDQYTDTRGRVTSVKNAGDIWTSFTYNAMGEQTGATDALGHTTVSEYDQLGRRISRLHPDAGLTTYSYDLVGNLAALETASMREAGIGAVAYKYDFERLTNITYPQNPENNVHYTYGEAGAAHNRAGRIVLQEDASGAQEYFYGALGEVVKNIRTIVIPQHDEQTFVTEWSYDTWNRLTSLMYPDGEKVDYTYNTGGLLRSMNGKKKGEDYRYVQQLGYDKFGQRVFLAYGNGTKTTYSYEADRRRLQNMVARTAKGRAMMDNVYGYDKVNNILSLKNNAPVPGSSLMGGSSSYSYTYDELYRLTEAIGSFKGSNEEHRYTLQMSYNEVGSILSKVQTHDRKGGGGDSWVTQKRTTYAQEYTYGDKQPHAPELIGRQRYSYDASGNQTGWKDEVSGQRRQIVWDEENRIRAIMDNGAAFHYTYDASGMRVLKGRSSGQAVYVNGQHKAGSGGIGNFTVYVNPYLVLKSGGYTKHFYIEGQRITSKLGSGNGADTKNNKAGGNEVNYPGKRDQVQEGIVRNLKFLGQDGAILTAGKSGKVPPGQIIGEKGNNGGGKNKDKESFMYFFHPDHLGSSSFITDASGEVYQHLEYFAFGETFVEEHSNTHRTPYLFNGKELDEETGLYYYGARYYDPRTSIWQSLDPLAEKYPGWSPYSYTFNNPILFKDPDGRDPISGIVEAVSSFVLSAGMDFVTGWLIEGNSTKAAFDGISWSAACWDAGKTYAMASVLPPGAATAQKAYKLANTLPGKIVLSISEKMTTKVIDAYLEDPDNFAIDKEVLTGLFLESTIETLVEVGIGDRADELLSVLKKENKKLYQKLNTYKNKLENGESSKRVNNYRKRVEEQAEKSKKAGTDYIQTKTLDKAAQEVTSSYVKEKTISDQ
ncbi:SpvB/TcaC N-terminal domain-containing protein [Pontibacter anaerobius]|uniref:Insecticide toxin TcdB middle/N-terminal domain-containing protein n=1 Tax=Pontibacter anaerobius TaxID=2993940 RepID=A0ABT3RDB1_9BACT|nr:SpvB/TcaC N-terminal domain-containing protein [Pontibacter anaerobius]MCX2739501.1 hypothetical protein [Pontibacter anaerobius]